MNRVICLKNVNFSYRVFKNKKSSLRDLTKEVFSGSAKLTTYHALTDVTLNVFSGEVLGVIGHNGAGKSTLLKILARVLPPTSGEISIEGTIAPLIELGAGFHPEMSGDENVLLYSAFLGRDTRVVKNRLLEISDWAGVTDHMDFPIKSFSSGMVARLAFATATDGNSDILLIDEILSVGDSDFQTKSKTRIGSLISNGTTVVFVSHDLALVQEICTRVIWLDHGQIKSIGKPAEVIAAYEAG
jgi:ABC-type polysaccharide/polyol phosphate transport system ATPase subunit